MNNWDFLDVMDKNLLYEYAKVMSGQKKQLHMDDHSEKEDSYYEDIRRLEQRRKTAYYLIWFVFRYLLGCKTYEETIPYQTKEILQKYKVFSYIKNDYIYIDADGKITLHKLEDICIALEIIYHRYGLFEQMECYIRNTKKHRRTVCENVMTEYKQMLAHISGGKNG